MVSTNGNGPKLASMVRSRVEASLPDSVGAAVENVGLLRAKLRQKAPGVGGESSKKRMQWITRVCTDWSFEELAEMDERTMDELLTSGWDRGVNPKPRNYSRKRALAEFATHSSLFVGLVGGVLLAVVVLQTLGYICEDPYTHSSYYYYTMH